MPALRTIQRWHQNSKANFPPGFCKQTLLTLKKLANVERAQNKELYISMCFDEMAIRRHIQWIHNQKRFSGFITYGERDDDEIPVANNAIFFLVTIVKTGHSLILGYFLIKTLNTSEKAELIKMAINEISETGAILTSIAFDGFKTNFSACQHLGASFDVEKFRPFLIDERTNRRISIVLDPPHMLKLVRNCLAAKGHMTDGEGNDIAWIYFEHLVSKESDLVSHRMTRKHIDFASNKMNVRLAAQTLSYSVARSMEVLKISGDPLF